MSFNYLNCISDEELPLDDAIDLTSPSPGVNAESNRHTSDGGGGALTPPLLNLRSRLQSHLSSHDAEKNGAHVTPQSEPQNRRASGSFRTVGDLNFGAAVAAGRGATPGSFRRNNDTAIGFNTRDRCHPSDPDLFAHRTQALLGRMSGRHLNQDASSSPRPLRERLARRCNIENHQLSPTFKSLDFVGRIEAAQVQDTTHTSPESPKQNPKYRALALVKQQLRLVFSPGELAKEREKEIRQFAVRWMYENYGDSFTDEHAALAVDKALVSLRN